MKKLLAVFLCLCLCLTVAPVGARAAGDRENQLADALFTLGMFQGVAEGDYALDRAPTRVEALVMLLRVMGLEDEALAGGRSHPFTDLRDWESPYVGYAYSSGITDGVEETRFGNSDATAAMYLTFILRALGYDDKAGDFAWDAPFLLAESQGLLSEGADMDSFLRGDLTLVTWAALSAPMADGSMTLAEYLINQGAFTRAQYMAARRTAGATVVVEADSFEEFSGAASELVSAESGKVTNGMAALDGCRSRRLIVQGDGRALSFESFGPTAVISGPDGVYIVQFESASMTREALAAIAALPGVVYAEPDVIYGADAADGAELLSYSGSSWGVAAMGAGELAEYAGGSAVVAVVDTGVDGSHPFLAGRVLSGWDFVDWDGDADDGHFHGTHVAGTIVDCTPGANVYILPVRVLDRGGSGSSLAVGNGIIYAVDNGADVINLSLGGDHSSYIDGAVSYAARNGVTVVASAGNDSASTSRSCPAHIASCITVSAINSGLVFASRFSNYGGAVDFAGPGVGVRSSVPGGGYSSLDGTSMAAPHISAAAALVIAADIARTPEAVFGALKSCCTDLGASGWDEYYGWGLPQLDELVPQEPEPDPSPEPSTPSDLDPSTPSDLDPSPAPGPVMPTGLDVWSGQLHLVFPDGGANITDNFDVDVYPENAEDKSLTWTSSNPRIIYCTDDGQIWTRYTTGTATVTVTTCNGISKSFDVSVVSGSPSLTWEYHNQGGILSVTGTVSASFPLQAAFVITEGERVVSSQTTDVLPAGAYRLEDLFDGIRPGPGTYQVVAFAICSQGYCEGISAYNVYTMIVK